MHILKNYVAKDRSHIIRYQELQHYKQTQKGVLLDYSEKIRASITSLQNKSSDAIRSTIHRSYKIITSSNYTNSSVTSGFSCALNISSEINWRSFSNGSLIFVIDGNSQKIILPTIIVLLFQYQILLSQNAFPLIFPKDQYSKRHCSCQGTFPIHIFLPKESSYPKNKLILFMNKTWKGI